jgi:hypothetical protein
MKSVAHQRASGPQSWVNEFRILYVPEGLPANMASRKLSQANQPTVVMKKEHITIADL